MMESNRTVEEARSDLTMPLVGLLDEQLEQQCIRETTKDGYMGASI